jgi:hypothetical protein
VKFSEIGSVSSVSLDYIVSNLVFSHVLNSIHAYSGTRHPLARNITDDAYCTVYRVIPVIFTREAHRSGTKHPSLSYKVLHVVPA